MDKFLALFNKYPWTAVVILMHWMVTASILIYESDRIEVEQVMGVAFIATIIYAYIGFKVPQG